MPRNNLSVVILAAGKGKRMNNPELPKVLALLNQKPLLSYVLDLSIKFEPFKIIPIIGHQKEKVVKFLQDYYSNQINIEYVIQEQQLGTGHAVNQTREALNFFDGNILILSGDVPLINATTIQKFWELHNSFSADLSVLSCFTVNPFGYGRIIRDANKNFQKIVEEKDASDLEKQINEINSGIYLVQSNLLFEALKNLNNNNAQQEYYLTDIIAIFKSWNKNVFAFPIAEFDELQGVNSQEDLLNLHNIINKK
jgi:UDP-N-acetylglucosamine diphosphorylase/glucosamine-1-phosphate N-acetyltransferase